MVCQETRVFVNKTGLYFFNARGNKVFNKKKLVNKTKGLLTKRMFCLQNEGIGNKTGYCPHDSGEKVDNKTKFMNTTDSLSTKRATVFFSI